MIKYVFSEKPLTIKNAKKANAQKIGEALASIATANDGDLMPQKIVDAAATDKRLRPHFEWDDGIAANAYRCDQAREIVRCVHIENTDTESGVARAFLSVRDRDHVSYRALGEILQSKDLQARILAQAEKDLISFENRYSALEEICALVRQARERLAVRRTSVVGNRDQATA